MLAPGLYDVEHNSLKFSLIPDSVQMSYPTRQLGTTSFCLVEQNSQWVLPSAQFRLRRLGVMLLGLSLLSACAASEAKPTKEAGKQKPPVPVVIATATQKTVPLLVQGTGTAEAYSTVSVKSQASGQLMGVYFKEGQDVKKGQLLFAIDSRPLQAALRQAEANRAKDIAQLRQAQANVAKAIAQVNQAKANQAKDAAQAKNAEALAQRYGSLFNQGAISRAQIEQFQTNAEAQRATVVADQNAVADAVAAVGAAKAQVENAQAAISADDAAIENAKIQLSYSTIYAPVEGRTGDVKVDRGNLVKIGDDTNPLVVISQIRPIYVNFSIPQRLLPELKQYMAARGKLEVDALIPKDAKHPERGELTFIDSGVDTKTGSIQLKATFANTQERLTPGQFLNVVLKLTEEPNAIVVPSQAVKPGQKGQFVYVVKPDKTVEARLVTVVRTINNQAVIAQGVKPGEQVVTDGQFNLVPGAVVEVKQGSASGTPEGATNESQQSPTS